MFTKYVSNVPLGSGTNYILESREARRYRVRAYFRPIMSGEFNWRIYYMNSVNSTFAGGTTAWRNRSGGRIRLLSAYLADGGEIDVREFIDGSLEPEMLEGARRITFDGAESCEIAPDAELWSDELRLNVPEGHYLAFEWTLEGDAIPCTPDHPAAVFVDRGEGFAAGDSPNAPLPAMFGCERPYVKRLAFLGDSITQGCQTGRNRYEMWVARISAMLPEYAVWNLGLGYARAADAATDACWLKKAKQNDVVVVTLGVNDLLHGSYERGRPSTAGELIADITKIVAALQSTGVDVILSLLPPFDFSDAQKLEWRAVNLAIPELARLYGCKVYNFMSPLEAGGILECRPKYGAHPNGDGGRAAADEFRRAFKTESGWRI